jgi:hypothetical protein
MKKLLCYVGINNKYVMCEHFPNDEEHAGLHDMLQDFLDYDDALADEPIPQGFYMLEFEIEYSEHAWDGEQEVYLQLKAYTPYKGI